MSGLDIEAIRERAEVVATFSDIRAATSHPNFLGATAESAADVPVLLDEIERYRAAAKRIEDTSPTFRTWTPDVRHENSTSVTVKRACNVCGVLIGDVTEAEMEGAIEGVPAPDVHTECPACNGNMWPAVLQALADERGSHAMTLSSFDAFIEEATEERDELRDEVEKLREWNDEIKAERDELALRCLGHEGEMREAGAELHDTRAALADALQVIADLRGAA